MSHQYKPKSNPVVTVDDVVNEQSKVAVLKHSMQQAKRETTVKLKRWRRELLAKQAWIKRHEHLLPERVRPVSPFDMTGAPNVLDVEEQAALDASIKSVFG